MLIKELYKNNILFHFAAVPKFSDGLDQTELLDITRAKPFAIIRKRNEVFLMTLISNNLKCLLKSDVKNSKNYFLTFPTLSEIRLPNDEISLQQPGEKSPGRLVP